MSAAWTGALLSIVATLFVCAIVLEKLVSIAARIKGIEAEQSTQWKRISDAERELANWAKVAESRAAAASTRLDALEKRPPVTNVTLQMPQPAPKQGKAVAK